VRQHKYQFQSYQLLTHTNQDIKRRKEQLFSIIIITPYAGFASIFSKIFPFLRKFLFSPSFRPNPANLPISDLKNSYTGFCRSGRGNPAYQP